MQSISVEEEFVSGKVIAKEDSRWEGLGIFNRVASRSDGSGCAP
jgi:hypothetical protein